MKTNILHRYKKANWNSDYFGVGKKSKNAKSRWRRSLKKIAKRRFESDMKKE